MNAPRNHVRSTFGLLAALAVAASLIGCDSKSNSSPTAAPTPVLVRAAFGLDIVPTNPADLYPRAGELLVDGQVVWAGEMAHPSTDLGFGTYSIEKVIDGPMLPGQHTLSLRITDQHHSPTSYNISGDLVLTPAQQASSLSSWRELNVSLATGQEWSTQFVVPAEP